MKVNVIVPCGGSGSRTGLNFNKLLAKIGTKSIIYHTISKFFYIDCVKKIILPIRDCDKEIFEQILQDFSSKIVFCKGGDTRSQSVANSLKIAEDCDIISIHDGARPYVSEQIILDSFDKAAKYGSGISGYNATDSMAVVEDGKIINCLNRSTIWHIQTPQSFDCQQIVKAYGMIKEGQNFTDDSGVYSAYIAPCYMSLGSPSNKKITFKEDLITYQNCYIGVGYDTHELVAGRDLILGGIKIEHTKGLLGHSDADVLTHAIMDAIFGACNERDIGYHFPDTDPKYKGISSILLLKECLQIIRTKGFEVQNINAVIMCQKPKLAKIIPTIATNLANVIGVSSDKISISATTTEGLGFVGREEGIATHCNCICYKPM